MSTHRNRVKMTVSGTPGTGTITLGSAVSGYQSAATAYGGNATIDILVEEGTAWEVARDCTYTHSGTTVTRGTLEASSTGSAVSFTSAAVVSVIATAGWGNDVERLLSPHPVRTEGTGSNQTISSTSTFTKVTCMQADYDSAGLWNNTNKVILPTVAGRYLLLFAGAIANIDDGKRIIFRLGVDEAGGGTLDSANAQSFDLLRGYSSVASGFVGGTCAVVVEANGARSFGVLAWQDSGVTAAVNGETGRIGLYAQYLGPII